MHAIHSVLIADDALMQSDSIRSGRQGLSGADSGERKLKLQCLPRVWLGSGLGQREKWLRFVWEVGTSRHVFWFFRAVCNKMILLRGPLSNAIRQSRCCASFCWHIYVRVVRGSETCHISNFLVHHGLNMCWYLRQYMQIVMQPGHTRLGSHDMRG